MMQAICYPKCSTCKKALKWLEEHDIAYEYRDIAKDHPSREELQKWYKQSGYPLKRFFNTSGNLYKELQLKDKLATMSEEEQLDLLSTDGMLVKRPIIIQDNTVLVGFKEEEWKVLL